MEEILVLNKAGSGGLKPACFNWERNPDINQREYEFASSKERETLSNCSISRKAMEPQRSRFIVDQMRKIQIDGQSGGKLQLIGNGVFPVLLRKHGREA